MREQPKDRNRLQHILEAIDTIQGRCAGMTREDLTADKVLFGGIVYHTMIIGESAYNLTKAFCKVHPETPWLQIAKMRHNLAHGYYQVDADIVWSVIQHDLQPVAPLWSRPCGKSLRQNRQVKIEGRWRD